MPALGMQTLTRRLVLPAEEGAVRDLRHALAELCAGCGVAPDSASELTVAASEALTNAVLHGSAEPGDQVHAWVSVGPSEGQVTLEYPGEPFSTEVPGLPDDDNPNGRGRFLMDSFCDRVRYSFQDGWTRLELCKAWDRAPASAAESP